MFPLLWSFASCCAVFLTGSGLLGGHPMEEKEHELQLSSLAPPIPPHPTPHRHPAPLLGCVTSDFALPQFSHP